MATYYNIKEDETHKIFISPNYNYAFNKKTGYFLRWGKTQKEDPDWSMFGPEILDLEISKGSCLGNCRFCYKSNGPANYTKHMTLSEFSTILSKMPKTLTQIAFGITDIYANPYFWRMMKHAKDSGIIPNYTTHGLDVDEYAARLTAELCGAVAVSIVNKSKSFQAIKLYHNAGCKQVNIHYMLSEETYYGAINLIDEINDTPELKEAIRAVVFLLYKPKGKYLDKYTSINDVNKYRELIKHCEDRKIGYGFDSCSCKNYFRTLQNNEWDKTTFAEPCESTLFSSYIDCYGFFYPCSFTEKESGWEKGIDVLNCNDFVHDIWYNERVVFWRNKIINSTNNCNCKYKSVCRKCLTFEKELGFDSCKDLL